MKKLVVLMMAVAFALTGVNAQMPVSPLNEGLKLLRYEKNKSALAFFKDAYEKNYNSENAFGKTYGEHREKLELSFSELKILKKELRKKFQ